MEMASETHSIFTKGALLLDRGLKSEELELALANGDVENEVITKDQ